MDCYNYDGYSLSNTPNTILGLFGISSKDSLNPALYEKVLKGKKPKRIITLFIDGFGYMQWKKYYKRFEFLKRYTEKGSVTPITTVFPSTTAAAVTSVSTGTPPLQHGLAEWYIYMRKAGGIIATLPFRRMTNHTPDSLKNDDLTADDLFKGDAIFGRLKKRGVKSYVYIPKGISKSVYSGKAYRNSKLVPYSYLPDLFVSLRTQLKRENSSAYFYVYIPDLDSMEHSYGPYTEQYEAQLSVINHLLKTELLDRISKEDAKDTVVIIIADHGQINVDPMKVLYLNNYKESIGFFELGDDGTPILPVGSPRDVFLHIKPDRLDEAQRYFARILKDKAKVVMVADLIRDGLFGKGDASEEFYRRIGNLAILPFGRNTVWWDFSPYEEFKFYGHHGGLSEEEMLIPFAIAWLTDLLE